MAPGRPTASIHWNAGRNGWASFLLGFGWVPGLGALATASERRAGIKQGHWLLHLYLGLWVLTIRGNPQSTNFRVDGN